MYRITDLISEAHEASDNIWFVRSLSIVERTDATVSLRLHIRQGLFIQVFIGELSDSLYFALIEANQRIFGIDKESGQWHLHPYENPYKHEPSDEELDPKPLLKFLSKVEKLIFEYDLL